MTKIGGAAVLPGRGSLLLRKMGMDYGDFAFARLKRAIVFKSDVGMQKRRREDSEEDRPCGHDEFRASHVGYYKQSDSPSQLNDASSNRRDSMQRDFASGAGGEDGGAPLRTCHIEKRSRETSALVDELYEKMP